MSPEPVNLSKYEMAILLEAGLATEKIFASDTTFFPDDDHAVDEARSWAKRHLARQH